jgi:hypothetical protein
MTYDLDGVINDLRETARGLAALPTATYVERATGYFGAADFLGAFLQGHPEYRCVADLVEVCEEMLRHFDEYRGPLSWSSEEYEIFQQRREQMLAVVAKRKVNHANNHKDTRGRGRASACSFHQGCELLAFRRACVEV